VWSRFYSRADFTTNLDKEALSFINSNRFLNGWCINLIFQLNLHRLFSTITEMKLTFDIRGNLYPPKRIILNPNQLELFFVKSFKEDSSRHKIFINYVEFVQDFKKEITPNFTHWIDGSFISSKKNPNDIDFVTIIEHSVYEEKRDIIDNKFRLKNAKNQYKVDAYTIELYPEGHKKYLICKSDLLYWDNWFGNTKKDWTKKNFPKGYVEINF